MKEKLLPVNDSPFRIYATADLHGYRDRLECIAEQVRAWKPNVLVIAGDITGYRDAVGFIRRINDLPVPVLTVRGNMDAQAIETYIEQCTNITSLHQKTVTIDGVRFVGMGGTIPVPFSSRICLWEKRMFTEMEPLIDSNCVLVVHPPPYGTLDEGIGSLHAGSRGLLGLVLEQQPKLLICGHIHERPGWAFIGRSLVVNGSMGRSGAGAMITWCDDSPPQVCML
jgi:hypothetical protein